MVSAYNENKRLRHSRADRPVPEIPSTPEKESTSHWYDFAPEQHRSSEVVNLERSLDNNDINEGDDAEVYGLGLPASQSLSEPDNSGRTVQPASSPAASRSYDDDYNYDGKTLVAEHNPVSEVLESQQIPPQSHGEQSAQRQEKIDQYPDLDTQALFLGSIPSPDFSIPELDLSIPEPDVGFMLSVPLPSTLPPPATPPFHGKSDSELVSEQVPEETTTDLDAWISTHQGQNIPLNTITHALKCTSMDPVLAEVVLNSLVEGKGVPTDVSGVWTEEDDDDLHAADKRRVERVLEKHGSDGLGSWFERARFLAEWNAG